VVGRLRATDDLEEIRRAASELDARDAGSRNGVGPHPDRGIFPIAANRVTSAASVPLTSIITSTRNVTGRHEHWMTTGLDGLKSRVAFVPHSAAICPAQMTRSYSPDDGYGPGSRSTRTSGLAATLLWQRHASVQVFCSAYTFSCSDGLSDDPGGVLRRLPDRSR
jgi:hypothetical protein